MVHHEGPGVRQMSTEIKFYFNDSRYLTFVCWSVLDLRVFDFYKFSTPRLNCQSVGMELSLGARAVNPFRDHLLSAQDNPRTALYYQL